MARDIQPEPGPTNSRNCLLCKVEDNSKLSLKCDTCKGWSHISCYNDEVTPLSKSFQWQCPNPQCLPNYHPSEDTDQNTAAGTLNPVTTKNTNQQATNRYTVLLKETKGKDENETSTKEETVRKQLFSHLPRISEKPTKGERDIKKLFSHLPKISSKDYIERCKRNKCHNNKPACEPKKKINLWSELPKISSTAYIGKEICTSCNSCIKTYQDEIQCSICQRLTHRKCSDMSLKIYKEKVKKRALKDLHWTCNKCRNDEETNYKPFSKEQCTEEQLPDDWDHICKGKREGEEIILHFNARSMIDKEDEIQEIAKKIKPDAIFITETWLDESCPKGTSVPQNYSIIRKDRSLDFKQKYGKNNGGGVAVAL